MLMKMFLTVVADYLRLVFTKFRTEYEICSEHVLGTRVQIMSVSNEGG
jgi:hypothetical protein